MVFAVQVQGRNSGKTSAVAFSAMSFTCLKSLWEPNQSEDLFQNCTTAVIWDIM